MCIGYIYSCEVSCLNSNLNTTAALEGSIESIGVYGQACHVTSCALVETITDATAWTPGLPPVNIPLLIGVVVMVILAGIALYHYGPNEPEEPKK